MDNHSDESIAIKISDVGGGIPRSESSKIWRYGYTTGHDDDLIKHRNLLEEIIEGAELQTTHALNQGHGHIEGKDLSLMFDHNIVGAGKYTPMFGLGYGLPITKLYARFFEVYSTLFSCTMKI